jgi:MOSC domain-containing protein YiiM
MRIDAIETRRNILTRGVALNHLVGREFRVGEALLRGITLCEPCNHLDELAGREVSPAFVHRGGLNAEVLEGGTVRVGDAIEPAAPAGESARSELP